MVKEHLSEIRSREQKAKDSIIEARALAAEKIEEARRKGEKLLEDAEIEGNEIKKSMVDEAKKAAEGKIVKLRSGNEKTLAALEESAGKKISEALDLITDEFRKGV